MELSKDYLDEIASDETSLIAFIEATGEAITKAASRNDLVGSVGLARLEGSASNYLKQLSNARVKMESLGSSRVAGIYFGMDAPLKHTFDTTRFHARILALFDWHNNAKETKTYMAPYFPLIQSSGMGKTKLLYEFRKNATSSDMDCKIIK